MELVYLNNQKIEKDMLEKCLHYQDKNVFLNCMSDISEKYKGGFEDLKKFIILLRRSAINELLQI